MTDIQLFKKCLRDLCKNSYTSEEVVIVVNHFCSECQSLLNILGVTGYIMYNDYGNMQKKSKDYAIDLIAPLFARNENSEFIILEKHFNAVLNENDEIIKKTVLQILNLTVKQGMIRYYEESDPIGKVFYRSIRYILSKKVEWEKSDINAHGISINKVGYVHIKASMEEVEQAFIITRCKSVTEQLKMVLAELIDHKEFSVPISYLLNAFRDHMKNYNEIIFDPKSQLESDELIEYTVDDTIKEIDNIILSNYVMSGKLTQQERIGFRLAIKMILQDLIKNRDLENYYYYLSQCIENTVTYDEYQMKYRKQFEYVAKKSKEIFSAMIKNGNNN